MKNEVYCPTHDRFDNERKGCQKCNERAAFVARLENAGYERAGTFDNEEQRLRFKRSEVTEMGIILRYASHLLSPDRRQRVRRLADRLIDPKVGNPEQRTKRTGVRGAGAKVRRFVCAHCSASHDLTQKVRVTPRLNRHGTASSKPMQHGELFNYFGVHEWCGLYVSDVSNADRMYRKDWVPTYRQMTEAEQLQKGKCARCEKEKSGEIRIGGDG